MDASSPSNVWAVGGGATSRYGSFGTLVLHSNGTTWTRVASPNPGSRYITSLTGITVLSRSDAWAVGSYYNPSTGFERGLILHWNGKSLVRVTGPHGLYGLAPSAISAVSPDDIWAIAEGIPRKGTPNATLLHWDGRNWSVAYSHPSFGCGGGPDAIWFASRSDGWAVGSYCAQQDSGTRTLILHWDGKSWTRTPSPDPGGIAAYDNLISVSGSSASDVWAVGNNVLGNGTLALHWNGSSWRKVFTPPSGGSSTGSLNGVSSVSRSNAWAVGYYTPASALAEKDLTLRWTGHSWTPAPSPNHDGTKGTTLNAVDAISPDDAWAVGNYGANGGEPQTWIIHWNGRRWSDP